MTNEQLIAKIAKDKKNRKLGKIVKIEQTIGKTVKINKPHAMVLVRKFMQKDILVPVDIEKVIEVKEDEIIFDLLKEEFDEEVTKIKLLREQQELYDGKNPISYGAQPRLSPRTGRIPEVKGRRK